MSRVGWIVLSLVALVLPAGSVCGMTAAESSDPCAMTAAHDMASCADEIAASTGCCDPGAAGAPTDLVLKRPDEDGVALASATLFGVASGREADASAGLAPDPAPPPRPSPLRLHSALLL